MLLKKPFENQMQKAFRELGVISTTKLPLPKQEWNAKVSFTTYNKLKREGILA